MPKAATACHCFAVAQMAPRICRTGKLPIDRTQNCASMLTARYGYVHKTEQDVHKKSELDITEKQVTS